MKIINGSFVSVILLALSHIVAKADLVTLTTTTTNTSNMLVLMAGDSAQLAYLYSSPLPTSGNYAGNIMVQTANYTFVINNINNGYGINAMSAIQIAGPAIITVSNTSGFSAIMYTFNKISSSNPNTVNVIPHGQGAVVSLQTTSDLSSGQWTTLFSQSFNNNTPTNQFFKFTMSAQ